LILISLTTEMPMEFGRFGARVENRPRGCESMKGVTRKEVSVL